MSKLNKSSFSLYQTQDSSNKGELNVHWGPSIGLLASKPCACVVIMLVTDA